MVYSEVTPPRLFTDSLPFIEQLSLDTEIKRQREISHAIFTYLLPRYWDCPVDPNQATNNTQPTVHRLPGHSCPLLSHDLFIHRCYTRVPFWRELFMRQSHLSTELLCGPTGSLSSPSRVVMVRDLVFMDPSQNCPTQCVR